MSRENEIKLRMTGPIAAREAVARIGAERRVARHLEDNVLLDDERSSIRTSGFLLRVRRCDPEEAVLTYKGAKSVVEGVRTREEIESTVGDAAAVQVILSRIGLRPTFRYQKYRETYAWQDVEIVVDETPVGTYLELEGPVASIHAAAAALGFGPADYITDSYFGLFLAAGGEGDMVFGER